MLDFSKKKEGSCQKLTVGTLITNAKCLPPKKFTRRLHQNGTGAEAATATPNSEYGTIWYFVCQSQIIGNYCLMGGTFPFFHRQSSEHTWPLFSHSSTTNFLAFNLLPYCNTYPLPDRMSIHKLECLSCEFHSHETSRIGWESSDQCGTYAGKEGTGSLCRHEMAINVQQRRVLTRGSTLVSRL